MTFSHTQDDYILRFFRGEKLIDTLIHFCIDNAMSAARISAIGGLTYAKLGFYNLEKKKYEFKEYVQIVELVSLLGTVALKEGQPVVHAHAVIANSELETFGGHMNEAIVGGTCEMHLIKLDVHLERKRDEDTGLSLLQLQ